MVGTKRKVLPSRLATLQDVTPCSLSLSCPPTPMFSCPKDLTNLHGVPQTLVRQDPARWNGLLGFLSYVFWTSLTVALDKDRSYGT